MQRGGGGEENKNDPVWKLFLWETFLKILEPLFYVLDGDLPQDIENASVWFQILPGVNFL